MRDTPATKLKITLCNDSTNHKILSKNNYKYVFLGEGDFQGCMSEFSKNRLFFVIHIRKSKKWKCGLLWLNLMYYGNLKLKNYCTDLSSFCPSFAGQLCLFEIIEMLMGTVVIPLELFQEPVILFS